MLIVRVELHSAITGKTTELARMAIINDGTGTNTRGNYVFKTYFGRTSKRLDKRTVNRIGGIQNWPRLTKHVWYLVAAGLKAMGYD